jgi:carbonic anhydrase
LNNLIPGLRKFRENVFPLKQELFQSLSQGQAPHTLMIACSDSRIDPTLVTQAEPGEIFLIRNAGNIVPPYGASNSGEEATIEYAVAGLRVRNIVICGHSKCGAMAALAAHVNLDGLPSVKRWLCNAEATKRRLEGTPRMENLLEVVQENVLVQADNLRTHPAVSAALQSGQVRIYGWVYNFEAGTVSIYDPKIKAYLPSNTVKEDFVDAERFAL